MPPPPSPQAVVPTGERSAVPSIPGIPAWAAVLVAVGASAVGMAIDALRGSDLTAVFAVFYVLGCVAAVVAVARRSLFSAMVQPPLIMFFGVPIAYQLMADDGGSSLKDIVLTVAIPLVNRFPLMVVATALTLVIGGGRVLIDQRRSADEVHSPRTAKARGTTARAATPRSSPQRTDRPHAPESDAPWSSGRRSTTASPTRGHGRTSASTSEPPIPRYPRPEFPEHRPRERSAPYSDPRRVDRPERPRPRPEAPHVQPYPPPRVRYRDRD